MSDDIEDLAYADCDYTPAPRQYAKCDECGDTRALMHHCDLQAENRRLRGMIWWLASDLAADDQPEPSMPEVWVELAERSWQLGLRYEARPLRPAPEEAVNG